MNLVITTLFGLEAAARDEILALGFKRENIEVTDGRITLNCHGDVYRAIAKLNIWLRTAERVLLSIGSGRVQTFDELYDLTLTVDWGEFIPSGWAFYVNGHSLKSKLFGVPACQSIIKKAIVTNILKKKGMPEAAVLPEDKNKGILKISFSIVKDEVTFMLDTSGDGLHKRGYRPLTHEAPLKETLAAGMIYYSMWRNSEALVDPMCGSGTIPIEATMISRRMAPGIKRDFAAQYWPQIPKNIFDNERREAMDKILPSKEIRIFGFDIDPSAVNVSRKNAKSAGVDSSITFAERDIRRLDRDKLVEYSGTGRNLLITNPPYGERIFSKDEAAEVFSKLGSIWKDQTDPDNMLRMSVLAPREGFETDFGTIADKRRKLYNGKIQCNMYHYFKTRRRT